MSNQRIIIRFLFLFAMFSYVIGISSEAYAGLCPADKEEQVHRDEALELESERYSLTVDPTNSSNLIDGCPDSSLPCYIGVRDYNERVIACNRERDVKRYKVGPVQDVPLVHKAAGKKLDKRTAEERNFADDLPPRMISGQMQYFGWAPKWYGYILEREAGEWTATVTLDFKFPNAEGKMIHLPAYMTSKLSTTEGGMSLDREEGFCDAESTGRSDAGRILVDLGGTDIYRACRIPRDTELFLRNSGYTYLPDSLGLTESKPATEWLMHLWRHSIENLWSRDGFKMKVMIANFVDRDDEIDDETLRLFKRNNVVYDVELHHNEDRWNNMYRPIMVGVKVYKAVYAGASIPTIVHEFSHSLGLDDEYANDGTPKTSKDCSVLSGYSSAPGDSATADERKLYVMCGGQSGDSRFVGNGDGNNDVSFNDINNISQQEIKAVYYWLITQRYSIGDEIKKCRNDGQCLDGQFCKNTPPFANRCTDKKAEGARCASDKQCVTGTVCGGKPRGRCVVEASKDMGETCTRNIECISDKCERGICTCKEDNDCTGDNQYCEKKPGKSNVCVNAKAEGARCSSDKQCGDGARCDGKPRGKCISLASKTLGANCRANDECVSGTCEGKICVCSRNSHCNINGATGLRCSVMAMKQNKCVKPCSSNRDCRDGTRCRKPFGTSFHRCK